MTRELSRYQPAWESALFEPGVAHQLFSRLRPRVAHGVLLPFVEAYRVVADVVARHPPGEPLEEKDCVRNCLAYGRQARLQQRISSDASIGKLFFSNGFKLMENLHLIQAPPAAALAERRLHMARTFRELQRRIERVRAAALP